MSVLFSVLLLAGCGQLPKVGEQASNDKIGVTVNDIQFYDQYCDTWLLGGVKKPKDENSLFALVTLTVENLGNEPQKIKRVKLIDANGQDADELIGLGLPEIKDLKADEVINPGAQITVTDVYVVPKGSVWDRVSFSADPPIDISLESREATMPPPPPLAKIGEPAESGGVEMTVNSVTTPEQLTHGIITQSAKPGSKLVLLDVTLKNVSIQPSHSSNEDNLMLIDANNKTSNNIVVYLGIPVEEVLPLKDLAPGESVRGKVLRTVPADAVLSKLQYVFPKMGPPPEVDISK
ncbi:MAG: DUF4352 domain-containing protein [Thermoleophilia bacterium]|jgi:hypothetical protein